MNTQVKIFKALADESRVRIMNRLIDSPMYVELLAERLELSPSTVSFHLKKLLEAGLVEKRKEQYYVQFSLRDEFLSRTLKELIADSSEETSEEDQREEAYNTRVIETFLKSGKLVSIPVQRKKRTIILNEIVKSFEFGRTYTEKEVNIIIADYHDDFATLRREMIAEKLLTRSNNIYERLSKE